jgi:predicted anti-sigma-YlaC factor YlaD
MSCEAVRPLLVAYQFAQCDGEERAAVEAHLVACSACVREFVDVKRAIELGEGAAVPRAAARAKLRAAVVALVAPDLVPRRWWHRPAALAFAASMLVIAMAATTAFTGS